jgi:hypothetical protein
MSTSSGHLIRLQIVLSLLSALPVLCSGCGKSEQPPVLDVGTLLARYERDRRRHDPVYFSEIDLGEFTVTQRHEPAIFYIRFHLFGVVPEELVQEAETLLVTHGERVRARVREAAQRCEADQLNDPSLGWLKSELITSINRSLQAPMLRDVVFAEFSFERG